MTKRLIRSHKGGRTDRAPGARMTKQERRRLDAVLERRGIKHTDWYIAHVNQDYAEITGEDTMSKKVTCPQCGNDVEIDETGTGLCERDQIFVKPANDGTNDGLFASNYDVVESTNNSIRKSA